MADKRCVNGHYIDESWDLCPYCPDGTGDVPVVRPSARETGSPPQLRVADEGAPATSVREPEGAVERTVVVRGSDVDPTRRYVVGWLVGLNGAIRGESYPVRMGRNVIGRDRRADVVITDDQASAHHADLIFRPEEARFILMDHNSTNGTFVNESEIEPRRDLTHRDVVRIGTHRYLFVPLCESGRMWDVEGELA